MKRGDLVTVALPGDLGKPRPALIIQADRFDATGAVIVLRVSSMMIDAPLMRRSVAPDADNGLRKPSQIMIDKITSVRRDRVGATIGQLDPAAMLEVSRLLVIFLGIG